MVSIICLIVCILLFIMSVRNSKDAEEGWGHAEKIRTEAMQMLHEAEATYDRNSKILDKLNEILLYGGNNTSNIEYMMNLIKEGLEKQN